MARAMVYVGRMNFVLAPNRMNWRKCVDASSRLVWGRKGMRQIMVTAVSRLGSTGGIRLKGGLTVVGGAEVRLLPQ